MKTQAVYNENKNKRKFKKITYEVQIDYAHLDDNGIHMGELDRTKRSRIVEHNVDGYGWCTFDERNMDKINCDKIKIGSAVYSDIYSDEYDNKVDHKYTYKVLSIEDY